ncbi:MAG: hypothetical protein KJ676_02100 [Alphaproteobacteria bacterium]|nr:hypothetical protein [Alphaproteobacteria bacterium]MBU1524906.1 hypothetical protein [Alphaproteobacteria bacterium]MBU2116782.1 hypothetical protein [Alphaproteobacteria bacterium]MBU2352087.1 hypothetical protein [Alphaproteobacteria bacterium]MBU2381912.1 hypothetical protein [Alphaproteobacteria bacterium]
MSPARHATPRTFLWPAIIAVVSLTGLVGALLGDGAWDPVGALMLGVATCAPVAAVFVSRRRSAP